MDIIFNGELGANISPPQRGFFKTPFPTYFFLGITPETDEAFAATNP
jgi:hypothetical protein